MLIDRKGNSFVEVPKTASTSITRLLEVNGWYLTHPQHHHAPKAPGEYRMGVYRNTYDRVLSIWRHFTKGQQDFSVFVRNLCTENIVGAHFRRPQMYWLRECDFIIAHHDLDVGMRVWSRDVHLEHRELPHVNKSRGQLPENLTGLFKNEVMDHIQRKYADDIKEFGCTLTGAQEIWETKFNT